MRHETERGGREWSMQKAKKNNAAFILKKEVS